MSNRTSPAATAIRHATLAASLATVLGLPLRSIAGAEGSPGHTSLAPTAPASHFVTTCVDDVNLPGSLRYEVLHAADNDTIDLTPLEMVCSTITLGSEIEVTQPSLNLQGPGPKSLTIDGNNYSRVFKHTGGGTLFIGGLTIANGYYIDSNKPFGGCVYSYGSVSLLNSIVSTCTASSSSDTIPARGGAVFAGATAALKYSEVADSQAIAHYGARAYGGGIYARHFQSRYSIITGNAVDATTQLSSGGGVMFWGDGYIAASTIASNRAMLAGGLLANWSGGSVTLVSSTLSSNEANYYGGLFSKSPATIESSTIAFNVAAFEPGAGVLMKGAPLVLRSSIIANNSGPYGDLGGYDGAAVVTASNNLVTSSTLPLPMDTLTDCPRLGPLADNGGPTRTHALSHASPAIDRGDAGGLNVDQRLEPRVAGAAADIGAFELQPGETDERIFAGGFEKACSW